MVEQKPGPTQWNWRHKSLEKTLNELQPTLPPPTDCGRYEDAVRILVAYAGMVERILVEFAGRTQGPLPGAYALSPLEYINRLLKGEPDAQATLEGYLSHALELVKNMAILAVKVPRGELPAPLRPATIRNQVRLTLFDRLLCQRERRYWKEYEKRARDL